MAYYQLRYNIYPAPGFPVEIEEWLELSEQDEEQIKRLLEPRHHSKVALIHSITICREEYQANRPQLQEIAQRNLDTGFDNVRKWKLTEPINTLRELNRVSARLEERYKYINRPAPLL